MINVVHYLKHYAFIIFFSALGKIQSDPEGIIETLSVTSHADVNKLFIALKSFVFFSKINPYITVIDDGSLTHIDIFFIKYILKNVNFYSKDEFDRILMKKFGKSNIFYKHKNSPFLIKKLAFILLTKKRKILLLDSDVIFYRKPKELIEWVKDKYKYIFISDKVDSYIFSKIECIHYFRLNPVPKLNSGLIGLARSEKNRKNLSMLSKITKLYYSKLFTTRTPHFQVFFALILSGKKEEDIYRLPKSYCVPINNIADTRGLKCLHCITPYRHLYSHYTKIFLHMYISNMMNTYIKYISATLLIR